MKSASICTIRPLFPWEKLSGRSNVNPRDLRCIPDFLEERLVGVLGLEDGFEDDLATLAERMFGAAESFKFVALEVELQQHVGDERLAG